MPKFKNLFLLFTLIVFTGLSLNSYAGIVCGDGDISEDQVNFPEECDDGQEAATNLCNNNTDPAKGNGPCFYTFCGDGIVQEPNNGANKDGTGFPEDCDPPGDTLPTATCDATCTFITTTTTTPTTTTTAGATTTTAAGTTTTTAAATTTTAAGTTTTAAATTTTAAGTTTTAAATTTTAAGTTTTTMGGGTTTTTATPTTTTTSATTSTTGATTTTTLPPPVDSVPDVPLDGSDETVTITTEAGETISNVSTGAATGAPSGFDFPAGTISYTTTSPVGGTVTMTFEFSTDLPDDLTVFKVDNNGKYTELSTDIWEQTGPRTVEVDVTDDGGVTDQGDPNDGFIDDPIAVAGAQGAGGGDGGGDDLFDFGGGGCTISNTQSASMDPIWLFLLLTPGLGLLRRRTVATNRASKGNY